MFEIANTILKGAVNLLADKNQANTPNKKTGNYKIRGHINNVPVDLHVENTPHGSTGPGSSKSGEWEFVQQNQLIRTISQTSQQSCTNCANCSNENKKKPQQQNYDKKPNNDGNKYCKVVIPDKGNFEVKIKKVEGNMAEMKLKTNQNNQNFNKQKQQQNFNQNKQAFNQNTQNFKEKSNDSKNNNKGLNNGKPKAQRENGPGAQNRGPKSANFQKAQVGCGNGQSTWMYLGSIKKGTTEFDLHSFLQQKFPGYDFVVVLLPLYKDAKLPSFKVKVDNRVLEEFKNPAHWPEGVKIKIYMDKENGPAAQNRGPKVIIQKAQVIGRGNGQSTWMYLGGIKKGTTEYDLQNYLQQKFPGHNFDVVLLPPYRDAKLPSFKVKVDNRILEEFKNLAHWPEGVKIIKYIENFKS